MVNHIFSVKRRDQKRMPFGKWHPHRDHNEPLFLAGIAQWCIGEECTVCALYYTAFAINA